MFHTISWDAYWTASAISCGIYYLIVYLAYFRNNAGKVWEPRAGMPFSPSKKADSVSTPSPDRQAREEQWNETEHEEYLVSACIDEIEAYFENLRKSKVVKGELLFGLHTVLLKYSSLKNSTYKESLNRLIATQGNHICSVHLNPEELEGIWFGW